ncbi:polymorphic toxin type 28 domain-containing protein, partial [Fictibacillus gelatini]|uniref:polymorphic toxin type 28 domain-containing protein n=1 Tax=Fictibacillus gelatini TaxID=225985 RepID=UPI000685371F
VTDTFDMVMHPRETLEAIDYADQHRIETAIYTGAAIYASWKRDIVNGDAYSRAEYVGNIAAQIVIPYGEFKLALKISDISKVGRLKALGKLKAARDKSVEFVQRVQRIRTAPKTIMTTPDGLHVPSNEFLSQEEIWQRFANGPDAPDVNHRIRGDGTKVTGKIVNELSRAQKRSLETLDNIIDNHLTEKDFSGTLRDLQGNPVPKPGGGYWNHLQEMKDSYKGLKKIERGLEGSLKNPNLSDEIKIELNEALKKVKKNIRKIEDLFEPYGGIE